MDIRNISSSGYNLSGTTDTGSIYTIWDGGALLDIWTDWISIGVGVESPSAAYTAGNGLLIVDAIDASSILLHNADYTEVDIKNYDFLTFWLNVRNWTSGEDVTLSLYSTIIKSSTYVSLSTYINFDKLQQWQRVLIPLERLEILQSVELEDMPTYVNEVEFVLKSGIDFWLDNIAVVVGEWNNLSISPPIIDDIAFEGVLNTVMSPFPGDITFSGTLIPTMSQFERDLIPIMSPFERDPTTIMSPCKGDTTFEGDLIPIMSPFSDA